MKNNLSITCVGKVSQIKINKGEIITLGKCSDETRIFVEDDNTEFSMVVGNCRLNINVFGEAVHITAFERHCVLTKIKGGFNVPPSCFTSQMKEDEFYFENKVVFNEKRFYITVSGEIENFSTGMWLRDIVVKVEECSL